MIKKVDLGQPLHGVFGNPAPLGLLGLAISCAALLPVAIMGAQATKFALITTATFVLFFGFACHLLTGLMEFANRNTYGGTIFTAFAFNWLITSLTLFGLTFGIVPDHHVIFATEIVLLIIFLFLTYGFGFFSKLLFYFLLDIDLLYICKLIQSATGTRMMEWPIIIFTAILGFIGLWLSLAGLINPISGKEFFKLGKPLFRGPAKVGFDFSNRRTIFDFLYSQWKSNAFEEMPFEKLADLAKNKNPQSNVIPEMFYLMEYGAVKLTCEQENPHKIISARLTASGIDLYEQLVLRKYDF